MTTELTLEKKTAGFVEYYNHDHLVGWAVGPDPAAPVLLTLLVDGTPKAGFTAKDFRADLRTLGDKSGNYGFNVILPRRTIGQSFEVVAADGISLPVLPNAAGLDGWLDRIDSDGVFGWVWRVGDAEQKLTVEILLDDAVIGTVVADVFREDLLKDGIGSGAHSFRFSPSGSTSGERDFHPERISVKVAGTPFLLPRATSPEPHVAQVGVDREVNPVLADGSVTSDRQPLAGLTEERNSATNKRAPESVLAETPAKALTKSAHSKLKGNLEKPVNAMLKGWAADLDAPTPPLTVELLCDGTVFGTATCNLFRRDLREKEIGTGRHGFELAAPANALNGRPHVFAIRDSVTKAEISSRELTLSWPSFYDCFEEFLQHSTINHLMQAPFGEKEKRCLAFMEFTKKWMLSIELPALPLVSIVMPAFNREDVIGCAIESVLAQSYPKWELIIIDDASSDGTCKVINSYRDPRIHGIFLTKNRGQSSARNAALNAATGEIVSYLDSDNCWDPDFLNVMVRAFQVDSTAETAYCAQYIYKGSAAAPQAVRFGSFNRSLLENRNFIDLNCFMHKHSLVERLAGFDEKLRRYVDWDLISRYTADKAPSAVPCILSHYYLDKCENAISTTVWDKDTAEILAAKRRRHAFAIIEGATGSLRPASPEVVEKRGLESGDVVLTGVPALQLRKLRKEISVVIPNYNAANELAICLASLEEHLEDKHFWLTIVDNASDAATLAVLRRYQGRPRVNIIESRANYGFTQAVNIGIDRSPPGCDVVILNNDAIATPGCFSAMQEEHLLDSDAGLIVPQQVLLPGTATMVTHVPEADIALELDVNLSAHHKNILNPRYNPSRFTMELTFAPFFCVYIPRLTLHAVGLLDAEFGRHYRSDRVYCDAVRFIAKKRIVYTPRAKLYHQLQRSTEALKLDNKDSFHQLFVKNQWEQSFMDELGFRIARWDQ